MSLILECNNCGDTLVFNTIQELLGPSGVTPKGWLTIAVSTPAVNESGMIIGSVSSERHICPKHNRKLLEKTKTNAMVSEVPNES